MKNPLSMRHLMIYGLTAGIFAFFFAAPLYAEDAEVKPECGHAQIALSTYYASLNAGALGQALRLHTTAGLQDWKVKGSEAFKAWAVKETRKGTLKRVRILDTIEGDSAFVGFEIQYADGTNAHRKTKLMMEKGCWKVGTIQEE